METLTLQTDANRLLGLVIHSLYTRPEIFLRELVSNASDALDRFRLESMIHSELIEDAAPLEIRLEVDPTSRTLTIRDNGIGMSRDEVIGHIGTIARSGTREFEAELRARQDLNQAVDLIGRFGVGFYSSFMVADRVTLVTRRAGEKLGTRWESSGDVRYTVDDVGEAARGTAVTLQLKPVDTDTGVEDFTDRWVLSRIVKRYADFVGYPIVYVGPPAEAEQQAENQLVPAQVSVTLNSMKPIWTRIESEVKTDEYDEFYKHISHDWDQPMLRMSFKAEGRWEYSALLFVPSHAPYDLYYHAAPFGIQLYSQRVLIVENCRDLLPRYLRFLKGVVDAADLPLNISRQNLQQTNHLSAIRRWLTRKIIDAFDRLRQSDSAKYETLWSEFGRALKEGISEDYENKERLTSLLLFESSARSVKLTSLAGYVSRMKPDQKEMFYLSGESRAVIERSPHLEGLRDSDYEVLYFTEPVDELVAQSLPAFEGRPLRSLAKGSLELDMDAQQKANEPEQKEQFESLLGFIANHLQGDIRGVRLSRRLTVSPACLTSEPSDLSPHVERLIRGKAKTQHRTLELNAHHPIVIGLLDRFKEDSSDPVVTATVDILFGIALLAEGSDLADSVRFSSRVLDVLTQALQALPKDGIVA